MNEGYKMKQNNYVMRVNLVFVYCINVFFLVNWFNARYRRLYNHDSAPYCLEAYDLLIRLKPEAVV